MGSHAAAALPESVLFPVGYSWLVLAGSLDVIMTYLMLNLGAIEVNLIADRAIQAAGLWGLIALKFMALAIVLAICEFIGRRRLSTARSLVGAGVVLNFAPVALSIAQLAYFSNDWFHAFMHG
jgi:hypothetical protein